MPLSRYDKWFGGKGGAAKAHAAMMAEHGNKAKADEDFYATMNKKKKARAVVRGAKHGR